MTEVDLTLPDERPVVLDTNVFSRLLVTQRGKKVPLEQASRREAWQRTLTGRTLVICAQTRAELLTWPLAKDWGDTRTTELEGKIAALPLLPVDDAVQRAYAKLTAWAKKNGHALQDKAHTADRWIAASAIAFGLPLASDDGIFEGVDGLELIKHEE